MTTASLPDKLLNWYDIDGDKGWSPKTSDIPDIRDSWETDIPPETDTNCTIELDELEVLSPLQIGGGALPEGHNLPAQIGGIPCIPGSSLRGSLLSWIVRLCQEYEANSEGASLSQEEYDFWQTYLDKGEAIGWKPKAIRFENIWLDNLEPFPLNPQQDWQIFNRENNKLGVLWQVDGYVPGSVENNTIPFIN